MVGVVVVRKRRSVCGRGVRWIWRFVVGEEGRGKVRVCGVVGVGSEGVGSAIVVVVQWLLLDILGFALVGGDGLLL